MGTIKVKYEEMLVVDPGYIRDVKDRYGEPRFDALKHVKTVSEAGDGLYLVKVGDKKHELGVDSGRLWILKAEFDCDVTIDAGYSGYVRVPEGVAIDEIKLA